MARAKANEISPCPAAVAVSATNLSHPPEGQDKVVLRVRSSAGLALAAFKLGHASKTLQAARLPAKAL